MIVPRIVLDTNVCLDLFVFKDYSVQTLQNALIEKKLQAITNQACRDEWLRVLEYPALSLDAHTRAACMLTFDKLTELIDSPLTPLIFLPICTDPDDQKFLELAYLSKAAYLFTKDKALLKLAKKSSKMGLFNICHPNNFQSTFVIKNI